MIADQYDLYGNRKRVVPYTEILKDVVKRYWWHRDDLEPKARNRLMVAAVYVDCLDRIGAIKAVQAAPSYEMALRTLVAAMREDDMPTLETISRGLREAKAKLEKEGYEVRQNGASKKDDTYDELLVQINQQTSVRDSSLEHRFASYLKKSLSGVHFGHNEAIEHNGQVFNVDFIAREYGLIVEIDGYEFHNDLTSFISDRRKYRTLQSWGYTILPFAGSELTITNGMAIAVEEIKAIIAKRGMAT